MFLSFLFLSHSNHFFPIFSHLSSGSTLSLMKASFARSLNASDRMPAPSHRVLPAIFWVLDQRVGGDALPLVGDFGSALLLSRGLTNTKQCLSVWEKEKVLDSLDDLDDKKQKEQALPWHPLPQFWSATLEFGPKGGSSDLIGSVQRVWLENKPPTGGNYPQVLLFCSAYSGTLGLFCIRARPKSQLLSSKHLWIFGAPSIYASQHLHPTHHCWECGNMFGKLFQILTPYLHFLASWSVICGRLLMDSLCESTLSWANWVKEKCNTSEARPRSCIWPAKWSRGTRWPFRRHAGILRFKPKIPQDFWATLELHS